MATSKLLSIADRLEKAVSLVEEGATLYASGDWIRAHNETLARSIPDDYFFPVSRHSEAVTVLAAAAFDTEITIPHAPTVSIVQSALSDLRPIHLVLTMAGGIEGLEDHGLECLNDPEDPDCHVWHEQYRGLKVPNGLRQMFIEGLSDWLCSHGEALRKEASLLRGNSSGTEINGAMGQPTSTALQGPGSIQSTADQLTPGERSFLRALMHLEADDKPATLDEAVDQMKYSRKTANNAQRALRTLAPPLVELVGSSSYSRYRVTSDGVNVAEYLKGTIWNGSYRS